MFTIVLTLLEKIGMGKYVALLILVLAVIAASSAFTFSKTKAYYVMQGKANVSALQGKLVEGTQRADRTIQEFAAYRELQADRVRALETRSSAEADEAQLEIASYRAKLTKAMANYAAVLAARHETPGELSSAAVDAINAAGGLTLGPSVPASGPPS